MSRRLFLMVTVVLMAVACSEQPSPVVLGPDEMVIGRSLHAGHVRLLTSRRRVITMKLADGVTVAHRLKGLSVDEAVWGLARSADGRLWTLAGTSQLAEIDQGDIARRLPLRGDYVGLFGFGGTLLLQPAAVAPEELILRRFDLETQVFERVGSFRASPFATRPETLVLNLVGCGSTQFTELPCWFNQDLRIDRVSADGSGRQQVVSGVDFVRSVSEKGLQRLERPGPIMDAHIDASGMLWVLVATDESSPSDKRFVLVRYDASGRLQDRIAVPGRPRLILDAGSAGARLLTGTGQTSWVGRP